MASITQTGPASFRALIRRKGITPLCRTFKTEKKAQAWARTIEADLDAGRPVKASDGSTVGDAIKAYRELRDDSPRSIGVTSTEHYMLAHLERDLGDVLVTQLTPDRLAKFCRRRAEDGAGPCTAGMEISKLGTVLRYAAISLAESWGDPVLAARPLLTHLRLVGASESRDIRPTREQLGRIREKVAPQMRDIIDIAVLTCMRRGEISRVTWDDFDEPARMLIIRDRKHPRQKVGNNQTIPLLGDSAEILSRQPRVDDRIFPVSNEWISDSFTLACKVCEITELHFHDLRHEGISRLFEAGYAIEQVALVSGHKSWEQLRRYTHLKPQSLHQRASDPGTQPDP